MSSRRTSAEDVIEEVPALKVLKRGGLAENKLDERPAGPVVKFVTERRSGAAGLRVGGFEPPAQRVVKADAVFNTVGWLGRHPSAFSAGQAWECPFEEVLFFKFKSRKPAPLFISKGCFTASLQVRDG